VHEGIRRAGGSARGEPPAQKVLLNTAIDLDRGRGRVAGVAYAIRITIRLVGVRIGWTVIPPILDTVSINVAAPTITGAGAPTITPTIAAMKEVRVQLKREIRWWP